MAASSRSVWRGIAALALFFAACASGAGTGEIRGTIDSAICQKSAYAYDLSPNFFTADPVGSALELRVQQGSRVGTEQNDGLAIYIADAPRIVRESTARPITLNNAADDPVRITLFLSRTCARRPRELPAVFEASAGTITFDALYVPSVDPEALQIAARLDDVVFLGPDRDTERVTLSGHFEFLYNRGQPAQRFP